MGLHPDFPTSPLCELAPEHRWLPDDAFAKSDLAAGFTDFKSIELHAD